MANNKSYKSTHSGEEIDAAIDKIDSLNISDYYDKTEIDKKLSEKIGINEIGNDYYNKIEIDDQGRFEEDAKPAQVSVGNIKVGQKLAGLSLKTILKMMLYGESSYPSFVAPTFDIIPSVALFGVAGIKYVLEGVLKFDRGQITPAYETSGFRAGLPYKYEIGNTSVDTNETEYMFAYDFSLLESGENEINFKVFYGEGEQPTDSAGAPYASPLPAGELDGMLKIIGLTASFSGLNDDVTEDDFSNVLIPLDDKNYEQSGLFGDNLVYGYQVVTPNINTDEDEQVVLLPEGVDVLGIQSWNVLTGGWSWYYGRNAAETLASNVWIRTDEVVSREIGGVAVNYRKYKYNLEDYGPMNKNYFRFFIREVE